MLDHSWNTFLSADYYTMDKKAYISNWAFHLCPLGPKCTMLRRLKKHTVVSWDLPMAITNGVQNWSSEKLSISQYLLSASLHHFLSSLQDCLRANLNWKSFPCDSLFWTFTQKVTQKKYRAIYAKWYTWYLHQGRLSRNSTNWDIYWAFILHEALW